MSFTFEHKGKTYWAKEMPKKTEVFWLRKHELGVLITTGSSKATKQQLSNLIDKADAVSAAAKTKAGVHK